MQTTDSLTQHRSLLILHEPTDECVLAIIAEAERTDGDPTQNCLSALENAGYPVALPDAYRVRDDGRVGDDIDCAHAGKGGTP